MTLICGLSRAGKTTFSEHFNDVIHLDTSGAYRGVIRKIKHRNGDVTVEGIYDKVGDRVALIRAYGGDKCRCIWLNTPDEVRHSRPEWQKNLDIPFEPPTYSEGWDEIIIIRGDDNVECHRR